MTLIITLTTIYILLVWRMWYVFRYAYYHEEGRFHYCKVDFMDYFVIFCPILNTIFCFIFYDWREKTKEDNNNIFKPNKPLK